MSRVATVACLGFALLVCGAMSAAPARTSTGTEHPAFERAIAACGNDAICLEKSAKQAAQAAQALKNDPAYNKAFSSPCAGFDSGPVPSGNSGQMACASLRIKLTHDASVNTAGCTNEDEHFSYAYVFEGPGQLLRDGGRRGYLLSLMPAAPGGNWRLDLKSLEYLIRQFDQDCHAVRSRTFGRSDIRFGETPSVTFSYTHGYTGPSQVNAFFLPYGGWVLPETARTHWGASISYQMSGGFVSSQELVEAGLDFSPAELDTLFRGKSLTRTVRWQRSSSGGSSVNRLYIEIGSAESPGREDKKTPVLLVSPADGLHATRKSRKAQFEPRRKIYTLTNTGEGALSYRVHTATRWLKPQSLSGTLQSNQSTRVTVRLTAAADKLKPKQTGHVSFVNQTNQKGTTKRDVMLSETERWRLSIFEKNDLFFGGQYLYGGMAAKVRTDIIITIEDGKYKNGQAKAQFASVNTISYPAGVFDCTVDTNGLSMDRPAYAAPGRVVGDRVTVDIAPENGYQVKYHCVTDTDLLKEYYRDKYSKLKPKALAGAVRIRKWDEAIKAWASDKVSGVRKTVTLKFETPMYPAPSKSITVPLRDHRTEDGTLKSIDYHAIRMQRLE